MGSVHSTLLNNMNELGQGKSESGRDVAVGGDIRSRAETSAGRQIGNHKKRGYTHTLCSFMGSQQSQVLSRQQQLLGQRRQQHLLTERASSPHFERSSTSFPMNKLFGHEPLRVDLLVLLIESREYVTESTKGLGLSNDWIYRSSSQSYPYPRTHTLVVVSPSRPVMENKSEEQRMKMRPPLNRTIPPIPESKSNDSIMTHVSEKYVETHGEPEPSTSLAFRESSCLKSVGQIIAPPTSKTSSRDMGNDGSLVIENRMAQNLAAKTAVIISARNRRSEDVPRSPLMSVAHSVRSKLTKLGSRFSRSDGNQNIRASTSLSSMGQGPVDKLSNVASDTRFKKSASMETRTKNPTKILGNGVLEMSKISGRHPSLNGESPLSETSKNEISLGQDRYSKLIRPKNLSCRSGDDTKTNSIVETVKVHLEPRVTQTVSPPDRIRQFTSTTVAFTMTAEVQTSKNQENNKEAKTKPIMNIAVKSNPECDVHLASSNLKPPNNKDDHDQIKMRNTGRQRSFIPLYTTPSRKLPAKKSGTKMGQAPLAECESSCIENSPAVEIPPAKFIPNKIRSVRMRENLEGGDVESQSPDHGPLKNSVRGSFQQNKDICTVTAVDALPNTIARNYLPKIPADCSCDKDAKSGNSRNELISVMTSSGFTTSFGFQDSPDKSPEMDMELKFTDITLAQKYSKSANSQCVETKHAALTEVLKIHVPSVLRKTDPREDGEKKTLTTDDNAR
uniref:Uncharacterized protein n=1 Tax=Setaria digitata TaxID=48799 RepID=A0A915PNM9_9BILA